MSQTRSFISKGALRRSVEIVGSIVVRDCLASETGGSNGGVDVAQRHAMQVSQSAILEFLSA